MIDGERYEPGVYKVVWDGTDDHGNRVASGIYLYRMIAGSYVATPLTPRNGTPPYS